MKQLRLTAGAEDVVWMSVEENGVVLERQQTILAYEAVALLLHEYDFETLLDIGSCELEHASIFRAFGKSVTTLDAVEAADITADFLEADISGRYDVLFCSHVLEHQRNLGLFVDKLFDTLPENGILALTTPPECTHFITLSHCNWLNAGMLLYHLVMAGFDCREARILTYGYNTSIVLRKKYNGLARRSWAYREELQQFLPACIDVDPEACQYNGAIHALNWRPVLDTPPHFNAGIAIRELPDRHGHRREASAPDPVRTQLARQLRELTDGAKYQQAVALIDGVDLAAEDDPNLLYYAGVCLGSIGRMEAAIAALKRAAELGYASFWCAYHLGLFEMRRGSDPNAAFYYMASLFANPARSDIHPLLSRVAPGVDLELLRAAAGRTGSQSAAQEACALGASEQEAGRVGAAATYFAMALVFDPDHQQGRARLCELAPDVSFAVLPSVGAGGLAFRSRSG